MFLRKIFKSYKTDIVICVVLIALCAGLFFLFSAIKKDGKAVRVMLDGKEKGCYLLSEDREIKLKNLYGENTLVIKDNKAYVKDSDCPEHRCEKTGAVSKTGEMIICLPHMLFIEVVEDTDAD